MCVDLIQKNLPPDRFITAFPAKCSLKGRLASIGSRPKLLPFWFENTGPKRIESKSDQSAAREIEENADIKPHASSVLSFASFAVFTLTYIGSFNPSCRQVYPDIAIKLNYIENCY